MKRGSYFAGVASFAIALFAGSAVATAACNDILAGGVWDISQQSGSESTIKSFMNWMCSSNVGSKKKLESWSAGVTIPIENLPVSFSGGGKSSSDEAWRNQACEQTNKNYAHASEFKTYVQTASKILADAWLACEKQAGLHALVQAASAPENFFVTVRYVGVMANDNQIKNVTVTVIPSDAGACDKVPNPLSGEATLSCTRKDPNKDIDVLVRAPDIGQQPPVQRVAGLLPKVEEPPPAPYVCNGQTNEPKDRGYANGRALVAVDQSGCQSFCRIVGVTGNFHLNCYNYGWKRGGETRDAGDISVALPDPGIEDGRGWIDVNKDGMADFCRLVGVKGAWAISCMLANGNGFGSSIDSPIADAGWGGTRSFQNRSDGVYFCRNVGNDRNKGNACLKADGGGTFASN